MYFTNIYIISIYLSFVYLFYENGFHRAGNSIEDNTTDVTAIVVVIVW